MPSWATRIPASWVLIAGGLITLVGLFAFDHSSLQTCTIIAGVVLSQSSVLFFRISGGADAEDMSNGLGDGAPDLETEKQELEDWRNEIAQEFEQQALDIQNHQRSLTERLAKHQEFFEYPSAAEPFPESDGRLSEQDREVHALLEAEAERVYEKIRNNEYTRDGSLDLVEIRIEALELVQRVAVIYSPDSKNALLETSFEQLARSASRICLHSLVLLEQLPLDVKRFNLNEMYGYVRKAVLGYGAYQQVAPWLKHVTRTAYAGRIAASTNPVTLGAWWLASEVGRRGAQKVVENVVNRQAVSALQGIVTIIGVEVANVYGPGFRQRDAAWVFGAELANLLHTFPVSRDSLQEGLREITTLPLRSEYDRIYLYRCVASHRTSDLRITDPTVLTRPEREQIAVRLEGFFGKFIHGTTAEQVQTWQNDVEGKLDLKLNLTGSRRVSTSTEDGVSALQSAYRFIVSIAQASSEDAIRFLESTDLMTHLPLERRTQLLAELKQDNQEQRFEPPDIDPSDTVTNDFLKVLISGAISAGRCNGDVEELLLETVCYFRRSRDEAVTMLDDAYRIHMKANSIDDVAVAKIAPDKLRTLYYHLNPTDKLHAIYSGISVEGTGSKHDYPETLLVVHRSAGEITNRLLLVGTEKILWRSDESVMTKRRKGFLIDDCEIAGGQWSTKDERPSGPIAVAGAMTGGGYEKFFAPLIAAG